MNVFLPKYLKEKHPWLAESALRYISMRCFLCKQWLEKCAVLLTAHQAGSGQSLRARSSSLLRGTKRGERLAKPCERQGTAVGKPGPHGELQTGRAGFVAAPSFARQLQELPQLSPQDFSLWRHQARMHQCSYFFHLQDGLEQARQYRAWDLHL